MLRANHTFVIWDELWTFFPNWWSNVRRYLSNCASSSWANIISPKTRIYEAECCRCPEPHKHIVTGSYLTLNRSLAAYLEQIDSYSYSSFRHQQSLISQTTATTSILHSEERTEATSWKCDRRTAPDVTKPHMYASSDSRKSAPRRRARSRQ